MRTSAATLTVTIVRGCSRSGVSLQCRVSGSPQRPPGQPGLREAGARGPLLPAAEVPGLAEAARPRLPSPCPASAEDADLPVLAAKTPFTLPAKDEYQGEAGARQ